jgi:adhesin/invasin
MNLLKSKHNRTGGVHRNYRFVLWVCSLFLFILTVSGFIIRPARSADTTGDPTGEKRFISTGGEPGSLLLSADAIVLPADSGSTLLTAIVRDADGQPVAGVDVRFDSEAGDLSPANATTGIDGFAVVTFTAGSTPGQAVITAEVGDLNQQVVLQINGSQHDETAHTLRLEVDVDVLEAGQQVSVAANLLDASGQPIGGKVVTFFGSLGEVVPASALSGADGRVTATFRAGNVPGQARISALAGYASASGPLQIEAPVTPPPGGHVAYLPLVLK